MPSETAQPSEFASRYEGLMGRWSRILASRFVRWLVPASGQTWLDVGCGTGALTGAILEQAAPTVVWGIDAEAAYIQQARHAIRDERSRFVLGDALRLPEAIRNIDLTVSALFLNLIPDPTAGLAEMVRVTRPSGRIATYVWDFAQGMQLTRYFWDAAIALDRRATLLDQGRRYPLCHPDRLRELFVTARLREVKVEPLEISTVFRNFDDYWIPIEIGHGRASEYLWTLEPQHRANLRELLSSMLPRQADGSIPLGARAWAIVGQRAA
jgi:SAM-dependent methyltransferase